MKEIKIDKLPILVNYKMFKQIKKQGLLVKKTPDKKNWIIKSGNGYCEVIIEPKKPRWKRYAKTTKLKKTGQFYVEPYCYDYKNDKEYNFTTYKNEVDTNEI